MKYWDCRLQNAIYRVNPNTFDLVQSKYEGRISPKCSLCYNDVSFVKFCVTISVSSMEIIFHSW